MSIVGSSPENLPPGLVTYLAGGHDRTERALRRTLASLADRDWLLLTPEDVGGSTAEITRVPVRGDLPDFEVLVLSRVRGLSRTMRTVPLSIVTDVSGEEYREWKKEFTAALDAAALSFGLTARRMRRGFRYPLALLIAGIAGTANGLAHAADRSGTGTAAGIFAFVFGLIFASILSMPRLTDYGKQVAAWERPRPGRNSLADPSSSASYSPSASGPVDAVAQVADQTGGRSGFAVPAPPSSVELLVAKDGRPPPTGQAWSSFPSRWHLVTVGPIETPAAGRPRVLAGAGYGAAFATIPCSLIGLLAAKGLMGDALAWAPAAAFVLFGVAFWYPRYRLRLSIPRRVVYRGQVVKRWIQSNPEDSEAPSLRCCCVDDGESEEAQTLTLTQRQYKKLSVGDTVQVNYSPRWQLLRRIRRVT